MDAVTARVGPHLWCTRLAPLLRQQEGSSYTVITGMLGGWLLLFRGEDF